jgi:hypothetical protein
VKTYWCQSLLRSLEVAADGPSQAAEAFVCRCHAGQDSVVVRVQPVDGGEEHVFEVEMKRRAVARWVREGTGEVT